MPRIKKNLIKIGIRVQLDIRRAGYSKNLFASDYIDGTITEVMYDSDTKLEVIRVDVDKDYVGYGCKYEWHFGVENIVVRSLYAKNKET